MLFWTFCCCWVVFFFFFSLKNYKLSVLFCFLSFVFLVVFFFLLFLGWLAGTRLNTSWPKQSASYTKSVERNQSVKSVLHVCGGHSWENCIKMLNDEKTKHLRTQWGLRDKKMQTEPADRFVPAWQTASVMICSAAAQRPAENRHRSGLHTTYLSDLFNPSPLFGRPSHFN